MITELKEKFETKFEQALMNQCGNNQPLLKEMVQYHFGWHQAGEKHGKRLRPMILLLSTAALGQNIDAAFNAAMALETFHNFTLVHDDIQDKGDYRQGRLAVWKKYGMEQAINTGDFLAYSAVALLNEPSFTSLDEKQQRTLNTAFLEAGKDVMRGQHLDMLYEHQTLISLEEYIEMVTFKTARLFSLAFEAAGILNDLTKDRIEILRAIGADLGIAFQIQDDYLGIWGNPHETGKSVSTDVLTKKKTYPILVGLNQAPEMRSIWAGHAPLSDETVDRIIMLMTDLKMDQKTVEMARAYKNKALNNIHRVFIKQSEEKQALLNLLDGMIQ